jgi:hypothetical protein
MGQAWGRRGEEAQTGSQLQVEERHDAIVRNCEAEEGTKRRRTMQLKQSDLMASRTK